MKYKNYMVAAALAATVSSNAWALIDMDSAADQTVNIADEQKGVVDDNGRVTLTNTANALDVQKILGFTIAGGTSKYVRINLTGAVFKTAPSLLATVAGSLSQGGTAQSAFAIFEVGAAAATPIVSNSLVVLSALEYDVSATVATSISYDLYETAANAVNQTGALVSDSSGFTNVVTASTGDFVTVGTSTALVATGFTTFSPGIDTGAGILPGVSIIGQITAADILNSSPVKSDTVAIAVSDLLSASNIVTLTGDVTNGVFNIASAADCATGTVALTKAADNASAVSAAPINVAVTNAWWVCVNMTSITTSIEKGSYTLTLGTDGITNTIGTIVYDTTTVDIPYITTYTGYNQRFFINNRGTTNAYYTTTFDTEAGVTATAGTAATGTALAGEITTIRANDMVTFTGGSRGAATIEIEAQTADIDLTTQIIDLDMGTTDTLVLQ